MVMSHVSIFLKPMLPDTYLPLSKYIYFNKINIYFQLELLDNRPVK